MAILGIDYGLKQVGLALADGSLADPLCTIPTVKVFPELIKLIDQHKIDQLIVGQPEGPLKPYVQDFTEDLLDLGYAVVTWPETLSSHDARQSLLHKSKSGRKHGEHSAAAAIILQSWLDQNLSPSVPLSCSQSATESVQERG